MESLKSSGTVRYFVQPRFFYHYRNFCGGMGKRYLYLILEDNKTFDGYGRDRKIYHPSTWQVLLHKWDSLEEEASDFWYYVCLME